MKQSTDEKPGSFATRYAAAWNARDLAAIMALHHPGGSYQIHDARRATAPVQGRNAIQQAFASDLARLCSVHFALEELHEGAGHIAFRSRLTATTNAGDVIDIQTMDLMTIRDGLVMTKHTFLGGPYMPQSKDATDA